MEGIIKLSTRLGLASIGFGFISETCLYDVDGGRRAVIFDKLNGGIQQLVIGEGTHFRIPFIQDPIILDVRSRPRTIHSSTGTKDLQMVNISLRVLSRPLEEKLPSIYQKLGVDFDDRVLPSLGNEVLKSVVAKYNAEELLSRRAEISQEIRAGLIKRAHAFDLILDDVSITHLTFGREFAKAIEQKQVAQQEAERQTWVVARSDQERKAAVIRAEGEAEAANLISEAIHKAGNGIIEIRRIDTAKEVAQTIAYSRNVTYIPSSSGGEGVGSGSAGTNLLLNLGNS
jgi:prohibitin 1